MKNHLKARAAPKTWNIPRKDQTFVARPNAGSQKIDMTLPLGLVLKTIKVGDTKKEINHIIRNHSVLINGKRRWAYNFGVGFMDVLSIPDLKTHYLLSMDSKGRLTPQSIDAKDAASKMSQARSVRMIRGKKMQLGLSDGRTIFVKEPVAAGTTVIVGLPEGKIIKTIPVQEKANVILTSGKHRGTRGVIESLSQDAVKVKTETGSISTKRAYAFVLGGSE